MTYKDRTGQDRLDWARQGRAGRDRTGRTGHDRTGQNILSLPAQTAWARGRQCEAITDGSGQSLAAGERGPDSVIFFDPITDQSGIPVVQSRASGRPARYILGHVRPETQLLQRKPTDDLGLPSGENDHPKQALFPDQITESRYNLASI
eukprot:gene16865-biopygen13180